MKKHNTYIQPIITLLLVECERGFASSGGALNNDSNTIDDYQNWDSWD